MMESLHFNYLILNKVFCLKYTNMNDQIFYSSQVNRFITYRQILITEEGIWHWLHWSLRYMTFNSAPLQEAECSCRERGHRMNSPKVILLNEDWANFSDDVGKDYIWAKQKGGFLFGRF